MPQPIRLSLFASVTDTMPEAVQVPDFAALCALLLPHVETETKSGVPLHSPAEYAPGTRRSGRAVLRVHYGVIDLDHITEARGPVVARILSEYPGQLAIHTTYSHMAPPSAHPAHPEGAYRVIVPLSRPVTAAEWPRLWPRLSGRFAALADPQARDASRIYYIPSHPSERRQHAAYQIIQGDGTALDVDALLTGGAPVEVMAAAQGTEPVSRAALEALAGRLRRRRTHTAVTLDAVLRGAPWAEEGHRDTTLFALSRDIAAEFPRGDMSTIVPHFERSVQRMHLDDPQGAPTLAMVAEKLKRNQIAQVQEQIAQETAAEENRKSAIRVAFGDGRSEPYTPEEVLEAAKWAGIPPERQTHDPEQSDRAGGDLSRRWLIQTGPCVYVLLGGADGWRYVGPYAESAYPAARSYLSPAPCELDSTLVTGVRAPKSLVALIQDYGTVANTTVADMTAQCTRYDAASRTMIEATCPLRPIEPAYHPEIATWLIHLGGTEHAALIEWVSWLLRLDLPCAALVLQGAPDSGKSMLAKGLARLWTAENPTDMAQVLGANFNAALAACPLVFADEALPRDIRGRTTDLRAFIQETIRPFKRKYRDDAVLRGAARVIIASNGDVISGETDMTPDDIRAIAQRLVSIRVGRASSEYLSTISTRGWVDRDLIAAHALYIIEKAAENRPIAPPRFLVRAANNSLTTQNLATGSTMGSAAAHWLCAFVLDARKGRAGAVPGASIHAIWPAIRGTPEEGRELDALRLYVSTRALLEHWTTYVTHVDEQRATMRAIGLAVGSISDERLLLKHHRERIWVYPVRVRDLVAWAEKTGFSSEEELLGGLAKLPLRGDTE